MRSMLENVRVIDFTANVSGPAASTFLADMGAEVIKVEKPGFGDDARLFPPYKAGFSAPFVVMNRGKKGVCIDLKKQEGIELFKEIVKQSDVVMENHRPGTMEKYGLGYEDLKGINPRLIMLSLSGYGQYGPLAERPAYDSIIQAMTGIMATTGFPDGPPTKAGPIVIDIATAMQAAFAICAALYAREKTGEGEFLDVSMFDVGVNLMAGTWTDYTVMGNVQKRTGNRYPYVSPFDTYQAKDGYFMICSAGDTTFHRICDAMGKPELKTDPRFSNLFVRNDNEPALTKLMQEWVSRHTTEELLQLSVQFGFPGSPILNVDQVVNHPHTRARGLAVDVDQPNRGVINIYGPPTKAKNSEIKVRGPAPEHGQHNEWLLREVLGKTVEEAAVVLSSGAMG
ncbi:MAG: CaiB/BaiF CoA transferase family protein [Thermodesulfobacteriota bacterium]